MQGGGGKAPVGGGAVAAGRTLKAGCGGKAHAEGGKAHAEVKGAWLGRSNNNDGQRLAYSPKNIKDSDC